MLSERFSEKLQLMLFVHSPNQTILKLICNSKASFLGTRVALLALQHAVPSPPTASHLVSIDLLMSLRVSSFKKTACDRNREKEGKRYLVRENTPYVN